jgi:hypothetical protein
MSLPNIKFTNNLGSIEFQRCTLSIGDEWEYSGRQSRHSKRITIEGYVRIYNPEHGSVPAGISERFDDILIHQGVDGMRYGKPGTLELPWGAIIPTAKIESIEYPDSIMVEFTPVTVTFVDEQPNSTNYTLSFFGLQLQNPRINFPGGAQPLDDQYVQMPLGLEAMTLNPQNGPVRTRQGSKNFEITLVGALMLDNGKLPTLWRETLTQRAGEFTGPGVGLTVAGYPRPFKLSDACPELAGDLELAHLIVVGSALHWEVESGVAGVEIQMICPPQAG